MRDGAVDAAAIILPLHPVVRMNPAQHRTHLHIEHNFPKKLLASQRTLSPSS